MDAIDIRMQEMIKTLRNLITSKIYSEYAYLTDKEYDRLSKAANLIDKLAKIICE